MNPEDQVSLPYQAHSDTSHAAAEEMESGAPTIRGRVLAFLRRCGPTGATDEETQNCLELNPSTQRPRRIELQRMGLVVDSGMVRFTRSNRSAVVWVAAETPPRIELD